MSGTYLACVAWRFCRAGGTSGEAARKIFKWLLPQSPCGFSALARLYYLARPTKTAMLRRLALTFNLKQLHEIQQLLDGIRSTSPPKPLTTNEIATKKYISNYLSKGQVSKRNSFTLDLQ